MTDGKITALEVQKKNKERVNVYIDGEFAFGLNLMDAANLRKGQILTSLDMTTLQQKDAIARAVERAVNFLSYRPRSRFEVRQNLAKKDLPPEVIDVALERLVSLGYLDDEAFARYWVENRNTHKPRSPMALSVELRQKGVPDTIIRQVVEAVDANEAAYRAAEKRLHRYRGQSFEQFRTKLSGFLQRRGFGYDVISDVIQRLADHLHETDPDYFID